MKLKLLFALVVFFLPFASKAQTFGNEWINYSQKYYSFKVYTTGIHKLDFQTLQTANVPTTSFTSQNVQVFGKQNEIPLLIVDGGDNSFDAGDYILFYAERNDGWLDTTLYENLEDQGNPKYSLYNDTIQYFFTWNNSTNNKRIIIDTDASIDTYVASDFVFAEKFQSFNSSYNEGEKSSGSSSSFYTSGEGWGNPPVNGASGYTWDYSSTTLDQLYQGADAPNITYSAVTVGISNAAASGTANHHTRHTVGSSNYILADSLFTGYRAIRINSSFPASTLPSSGATNLKVNIVPDLGALTDFQSINYFSFTYPKIPNIAGAAQSTFRVVNHPIQTKTRLDLTNLTSSAPTVWAIGDFSRALTLTVNGSTKTILIPNNPSGSPQQVWIQDASTFTQVTTISPVNPGTSPGTFTDFSQLSAEKALLMIYNPYLQSASAQYAAYRMSPEGGNHNVILADVYELYQQFGGGIHKHINGIRRFAFYMYTQATEKPVGLFLMGKGIREANVSGLAFNGPGGRSNISNYSLNLIPSFGFPSSDNCITSNLPGTTKWTSLIPTGRVVARTNDELANYLEKLILYEQQQDPTSVYNSASKDWQKQVLHFVGGTDISQQTTFQGYMSNLKNTIEQANYGAHVKTVAKTNDDPLPPGELNAIMDRIRDGVSLINFFGHSEPTTSGFEINIDEPANWDNYGKYPVMIANSCYNGNIFESTISKSEQFISTPDFGPIAYLGTVNLGFASTLYQFSNELYKELSVNNYGKTLGEQMHNVVATMETFSTNLFSESTATQMSLNGDPMLRMNPHNKPEIELTEQGVSFSPETLDLSVDSIEISIALKNLGRSVVDTFSVDIIRDLPGSNVDSLYSFYLNGLDYTDTVHFKVPLLPGAGVGLNTFTIKADLPTFVDEQYDEIVNNQITKTLFINVEGIQPVLPYPFAVVPNDSVTVMASTVNPIAPMNTYRFELDTIDFVGAPSPFHRYAIVSGLGGVKAVPPANWTLSSNSQNAPLVCTDSTVYFWRVSVEASEPIWRESSFQYIENKEGWGQDHFYQFKDNDFSGVNYDRPTRTRDFFPYTRDLSVDVLYTTATPQIYGNLYSIDQQMQDYGILNYNPKWHVAIIDQYSLEPWGTRFGNQNLDHFFGNNNDNYNRVWKYFTFHQNDAAKRAAFKSMIENSVPDGDYILIYSPMTAVYDQWEPEIFTMFQNLGSDSIVPGRPNLPFAFFCRKGDTSSVVERYAMYGGQDVHLDAILEGVAFAGLETAPLIGPSAEWKSLFWKQDTLGTVNADSTVLYVNAYDAGMILQTTIPIQFTPNDSIINLSGLVDASQYPYIRLGAFYKDSLGFTPAQIDRWHVLFTPLPEAAIDGTTGITWLPNSDTLSEGQQVQFAVDVKNIFNIPMDSLLVSYWVEDANQVKHPLPYPRQDSLLVGETMRDTISFSTLGLAGMNILWMEVNPYVAAGSSVTDQPEQVHFNNLIQVPFRVNGDNVHPILDVTFNGKHILNGDIIAPESEVLITLKDENQFQIMNDVSDTTLFGIYLTDPDGNQKRIPFVDGNGNTVMQWIPAETQNKRFKIVYPALFEKDGKYTLFVQGSDRSGNASGDMEYRISFEVIHESMITYMMNYPNPFSTNTKFVFTLTGNEVPDEMIIQIMTVSGKVVREITEDQLGPIQIGRNISEYSWDGTDEYGDPLANGVYLYTVKAQINGEDIKHMESGADSHFKKEFGKMYILR
jgi:hypothetical protein